MASSSVTGNEGIPAQFLRNADQAFFRGHPMRLIPIFALLGSVVITSACATPASTTPTEVEAPTAPEPALYSTLPENVDSFELKGYKHFEDGSDGYSVRYANERKRRMADLYVYPVAEENADMEHSQLVLGSTRATLMAIGEATRKGHYANFNVINAATRAQGVRTIARVQATYLRQNLASYTLVYQTEHEGTLLKIRVTMPDNEHNRSSREWDEFADTMFKTAIEGLEAAKSETGPTKSI